MIDKIRKWLHRCNYSKPIISQYWTFHSRRIIYECKCGKRQMFKITLPYDVPFDIETTYSITNAEMDKILNKNNGTKTI
jgi:hypothetical protein